MRYHSRFPTPKQLVRRRIILSKLNTGQIDVNQLIEMTAGFTPADIQYFFDQVAYFAFEQELEQNADYRVTTDTFIQMTTKESPSLSSEVIEKFEKDSVNYFRASTTLASEEAFSMKSFPMSQKTKKIRKGLYLTTGKI